MFTGIIESIGIVNQISNTSFGLQLTIATSNKIYNEIQLGDSLSVDGVCLTVTNKINKNNLCFDVVKETIDKTNLSSLKLENKVNLETAIKINESLGGHIVQGHIDTTGIINDVKSIDKNFIFEILINKKWLKYCIQKGSIAINGISLTIAEINDNYNNESGLITVSIIPHTYDNTNLQFKKKNDLVNIETDFFGKYIEKLLPTDRINK